MSIRLSILEHGPTEGAAKIADWARERGYPIATIRLDLGEPLPELESFDLLVVMGGGMNIYQYRDFPWLRHERELIQRAIAARKAILGVCLGAQLLADALGARVTQNSVKEIGWLPVRLHETSGPFARFPPEITVFHWHGDTFDIPEGATHAASTEGCENQAFLHGDRLIGLQFHIEVTCETIADFIRGGESEMIPGPFVQSPEQILTNPPDLREMHVGLWHLLDHLAQIASGASTSRRP
jgi:GMP synthase-like glutamine amidotransferase